jgi:DNA-binding Lrp family transcriptional regulator
MTAELVAEQQKKLVEGGRAMENTIFVMVKCDPGKAYEVADHAVSSIPEIRELWSVSGQCDLLVKCRLPSEIDAGLFVVKKLQRLPGIRETYTMMAFRGLHPVEYLPVG